MPASIGARYHVLEELGRGGMGVVYRVRDSSTQRQLALKQLWLTHDPARARQATSLFEREFYVLAQLAHPGVIAVYDYGLDPNGPYYTMELLDGGDLKALAPLSVARACALMIDVCSSLALLHARRFVHRDLSPRNIRCTRDGRAKLIDFGAMVPMGPCTHVVGTPAFVAPEVLNHSTLDARADLFSLGATLYYALTGRPPFAAKELGDLRELWSRAPVLPSQLVADIPSALDALCAALLRIDPGQRPRSAFEVMQRLQAIAGLPVEATKDVARAYLTAPALIGREGSLRWFGQRMRRALHGQGCALLIESAAGLGRSRVLDACALEAKTLGATVLRAAASSSADRPFAVAQALAEQLIESLPRAARLAAEAAAVSDTLFGPGSLATRLRALDHPSLERTTVQAALCAWITRLCQTHALLIAVDDLQHADEASAALLAALTLEARDQRVVVCVTADEKLEQHVVPAFRVIAQQAQRHGLRPLTRPQTEELLASVFGSAPHLTLLAERLFQVSLGSPRDTMELARHLVDRGTIRYGDGHWTLPGTLEAHDLPATTADALAARVSALPPLARRFAESQALLGHALRRTDYALLAPDAGASALDQALMTLLAQEIVHSDGAFYVLSQRALSDALCALLEPEHKRARHLALYELYRQQPDAHPYLLVHHLLEAEDYTRALDVLNAQPLGDERKDGEAALRAEPKRLVSTLLRALELAVQLGRPARETHELRRRLCGMRLITDNVPHAAVEPWLAQLERDSGLADYRALEAARDPGARLQQALSTVSARFAATPEPERVYRCDQAIRHLAIYVVSAIGVSARTLDPSLASDLPALLEPFAPISPVMFALWQNAVAVTEAYAGKLLGARTRWLGLYERLAETPADGVRFVRAMQLGITRMLAIQDAAAGRRSALRWASELDSEVSLRAAAMSVRRLLSLMHGDLEAADSFAKQAELLALRSTGAEPFFAPQLIELQAYVFMHDLAGIQRVMEALMPLAEQHPSWRVQLQLAGAWHALRRGDVSRAHSEFSALEAHTRQSECNATSMVDAWISAVVGTMSAQNELGLAAEARTLGQRALQVCAARDIDLGQLRIAEQLALAEARLGHFAAASTRLEAVIAQSQQLELRGLQLAHCYGSRARIAIWARDADAAARYTSLAAAEPGGDKILAAASGGEAILAEARRAGLDLSLAPTAFEASLLGSLKPVAAGPEVEKLTAALADCQNSQQRAQRVLDLLCELAAGQLGQLFLVGDDGQLALVAHSPGVQVSAADVRFAQGFFAQQIDDEAYSAELTQATHMLSVPGAAAYIDPHGRESRLFMLTCNVRGTLVYVGLAVLRVSDDARLDQRLAAQLAVVSTCLLQAGDTRGIRHTSYA